MGAAYLKREIAFLLVRDVFVEKLRFLALTGPEKDSARQRVE